MRAFIENEIYFTKIKFNAADEGGLTHTEYKHWINAYEALLENLPEDKVMMSTKALQWALDGAMENMVRNASKGFEPLYAANAKGYSEYG